MAKVNQEHEFNKYNVASCRGTWSPADPLQNAIDQYNLVESMWLSPGAGLDAAQTAATMWAGLWTGSGQTPVVLVGAAPKGLLEKKMFELDYLAAPMLSVVLPVAATTT